MAKNDKKWPQNITDNSHALDLEEGVFTWKDPEKIAESLMQSALESRRRKAHPTNPLCRCLKYVKNFIKTHCCYSN